MFQTKKSIIRNKLYNSILASKIEIDKNNIEYSCKKINNQLSNYNIQLDDVNKNFIKKGFKKSPTIYNLESLYRDNTNDRI